MQLCRVVSCSCLGPQFSWTLVPRRSFPRVLRLFCAATVLSFLFSLFFILQPLTVSAATIQPIVISFHPIPSINQLRLRLLSPHALFFLFFYYYRQLAPRRVVAIPNHSGLT